MAVALVLGTARPAASDFTFERRIGGIPVTDGSLLLEPFTGGLNSPKPHLADLDHDLDLDLLIVQPDGGITHYRNDGSPAGASYRFLADRLQGIDANSWATLADIDADGDLDLFADGTGAVVYYRNVGTPANPVWQLTDANWQGIVNSGFGNTPSFTDVDGDGDLDYLEMEQNFGTARFYRNQGTPQVANMVFVTNTFGCIDTFEGLAPPARDGAGAAAGAGPQHGISVIATANIDADPDVDIFIGDLFNNNLYFFRNDPGACSPPCQPPTSCYTKVTHDFLPLATLGLNQARFGDLDADGDLDLLVGVTNQSAVIDNLIHFINNGTPQAPSLVAADLNYLKAIDVGRSSHPAAGDVDGDVDLDLFLGRDDGQIAVYTNSGTPAAPAFARGPALRDAANAVIDVGTGAAPVWIDNEGDGDLDLFVGTGSPARVRFYRNEGTPSSMSLVLRNSQVGNVTADFNAAPALGDLDADGDLDLLIGEFGVTGNPRLFHVRNDGTSLAPIWTVVCDDTPATCVFAQRVWTGDLAPELSDLDGDGDLDLLLGERDGNVNFYRNAGTPQAFNFVLESEAFAGAQVGFESAPEVVDVDGDGHKDLWVGEQNGGLNYFRRVPPIGVEDPGAPAPAAAPRLVEAAPNPTRGGAAFVLELPAAAAARGGLYAPDGRLVLRLADRRLAAGRHRLDWDGRDAAGAVVPAGIYFLRLDLGGEVVSARIAVVR